MSSITIIQQRDAVHFITDAAHYTPAGLVVAIGSKITELPASGCAFSVRGAGYSSPFLAWTLKRCTGFDQIMRQIPGIMSAIDTAFMAYAPAGTPPVRKHYAITFAGWSDDLQQMATGVAATWEQADADDTEGFSHLDGYQQFCPFYAPAVLTMPPVSLEVLGREVQHSGDWVEAMNPDVDGLAIFEAQRCFPAVYEESAQYVVGGFAELTTVRREGISRQILREYPDQIGAFIIPEGAEPIGDVWARELAWRAENQSEKPLASAA